MRVSIYLLVLSLSAGFLHAQQNIRLTNASFEGEPQDATVPVGWFACEADTTPDILPGPWGVYTEASEGETFMGLITRSNGSWESIGQRLGIPLQSGECYSFSLDLAHSKTYSGYSQPLRLRVWGSGSKCAKKQLLAETDFIKHSDWETYHLQFSAKQTIHYVILEAYYKDEHFSYEGNILIDNITPFHRCNRAMLIP